MLQTAESAELHSPTIRTRRRRKNVTSHFCYATRLNIYGEVVLVEN